MVSQVYLKAIWYNGQIMMWFTGVVMLMINVAE